MNKKLIALAVASLISVPAFAAGSEVQLYGMLDAGVDNATNVGTSASGTESTNNVGRVSDYGSYFGLKGSEDLSNGLSGIWQIEQGVSVNGGNTNGNGANNVNGSQNAFGANPYNNQRNTFVGLSSQTAGTVLVGIHDTPYKMSTAQMDPFADTLGDYNGLVGSFGLAGGGYGANSSGLLGGAGASGYFDLRPSQVLAYVSPDMNGLTVVGAYVFGNATNVGTPGISAIPNTAGNAYANNTTGDVYSLAAMYTAGPLYLTASYEQHDFGAAGNGSLSALGGGLANESNSAYKLGAAYSIMDTTLSVLYENSSDNFGTNGANLLGHDTWYVSAKHSMGAWDIALAYANAGSDNTTSAYNGNLGGHYTGAAVGASTGAQQWTIGGDYNFSKNTQVYALFTEILNQAGSMYNFADTTDPVAMFGGVIGGANISAVSLGIKHTF